MSYLKIPMSQITDKQLRDYCADFFEHFEVQANYLSQCCDKGQFRPATNLDFHETFKYFKKDVKKLSFLVEELYKRNIVILPKSKKSYVANRKIKQG